MKYLINKAVIISLLCSGCATMERSILTGSASGAAVGGLIGSQHSRGDSGKTATGALVGAALGGLIGYLTHKQKNKTPISPSDNKKIEELFPNLTRPKVRMYWVPDKIMDNQFIEKHRVWTIEKNSTWSQ